LRSGVCGSAVKWAGLAMASRLARLRGELGMKFAIVGVGGVGNAAAFDEYRRAGADAGDVGDSGDVESESLRKRSRGNRMSYEARKPRDSRGV
jgi:hypothetical protein